MNLDKKEKELIIHLLKKELKEIDTPDESSRYENDLKWLALEEKYEIFLENLIKKLD